MKQFDLWVGEWKGSGWASSGAGQRHEISMDEKVQRKVGGTVLLVEGRGTTKTDRGEVVVTHEALASCTTTTRRAAITGIPMTSAEGRSMWSRSWWTVDSNGVSGSRARGDDPLHDPI